MNSRRAVVSRAVLSAVATMFLLALPWAQMNAATDDAAERTHRHQISSKIMGETREILVRTPPGFERSRSYPTVYVLDAEWNFELVAGYLDYMVDNGVYPPLVVTGVINVNRNRDYVPRPDPHFDDTGGADRFLDFVGSEWIPLVAAQYPVSADRVLVGHSFGGVFTLHALFSGRQLFDAYIALGSSAWIADGVLFEEANAWFRDTPDAAEFVYMAVGEGDGGPTVPSSRELATLFEQKAPASLEWQFEVTPRTDHFKNTVSGLHEAFMQLFPAWGFAESLSAAGRQGPGAVDQWFAARERELGYRFMPAWFDLGVAASGLARDNHAEAALAIMRHLRRFHPEDAHVAAFSAGVYEAAGDPAQAINEYQRGIALARSQALHPNAIHLDRLQRGLERARLQLGENQ